MTRILAPALTLLLSACAAPLALAGTTPRARDAAYDCAAEQLDLLGYVGPPPNREAGQIRGQRLLPGEGPTIEPGRRVYGQLDVRITQESATGPVSIRITPMNLRETGVMTPFGWGTQAGPPGEESIADARRVLLRCDVPESAIQRG